MPEPKLFVTWNDSDPNSKTEALAEFSKALASDRTGIERARATNIFQNIAPGNVSIREGYTRRDFEMFRPGEQIPKRPKDIIMACMSAYSRVGLIRNVIDTMCDFATQGVNVVHPNKQIDKFYKEWFKKVRGKNRTERFVNNLLKAGNVIVKRTTAKVSVRKQEEIQRGTASPDLKEIPEPDEVEKREIPWAYTFLNPLTVEIMGEELLPFITQDGYTYALRLPESAIKKIKNAGKSDKDRSLLKQVPSQIKQYINEGKKLIPLDNKKIEVYYYKRDDWQVWAEPMIYSILPDLRLLEKMKLADLSALDGCISHVRLWKLGDLEHKILPTEASVNRLATILLNNVGGGSMDLIWGPELDFKETSTDVYQFLGENKYKPVLNQIYAGLGIPPTLTGSATQSGFTNNFISLRTLTERLQYVRDIIIEFWTNEIKLVQRALGFRFPALLVFDRTTLTDDSAEKALLIQLLDRGVVSDEAVQDIFGFEPEVENMRTKREGRARDVGKKSQKAGPFHQSDKDHELKKIALQGGGVTPSEVGLDLEDKKPGQVPPIKMKPPLTNKLKGQPGQGRPKNKKDSTKRKQKRVLPRTKANASLFINTLAQMRGAQRNISDLVDPVYLKSVSKSNLRKLSNEQVEDLERYKFGVLCNLPDNYIVNGETIAKISATAFVIPPAVDQLVERTKSKFFEQHKIQPTLEDVRQIQSGVIALYRCNFEENEIG